MKVLYLKRGHVKGLQFTAGWQELLFAVNSLGNAWICGFYIKNICGHAAVLVPILRLRLIIEIQKLKYKKNH